MTISEPDARQEFGNCMQSAAYLDALGEYEQQADRDQRLVAETTQE